SLPFSFGDKNRYLTIARPQAPPINALEQELRLFARSIRTQTPPPVDFKSAYDSLVVAHQILDLMPYARAAIV
ncbi:MAG: hypothetical protein RMM53_13215, partial [Bacteroidia bacterium]|nr:hypothetical protein [Bacteroidia bacterium]MDW8335168.1 hypothetical protein [Bacteroidia bacterium]